MLLLKSKDDLSVSEKNKAWVSPVNEFIFYMHD